MKWTFTYQNDPHEAEWQKGAMRCTMPEVIGKVDEIIFAGGLVPCGSAVNLVEPTLETEAGGFAVITLAIQQYADFMSLKMPLSDATVITDVIFEEDFEKAKSFDGDRSAAGQYAARVRWGNRKLSELQEIASSVRELDEFEAEMMFQEMYEGIVEETFTQSEINELHGFTVTDMATMLRHPERHSKEWWDEHIKKDAETLDSAFEHALPLPRDLVTYRGIRGDRMPAILREMKIGDSFTDVSFPSTTTDKAMGINFASRNYMLEVVIPKGTKAIPMRQIVPYAFSWKDRWNPSRPAHGLGRFDEHMEEFEVLLPRNGKMTLIDKKKKGDINIFTVVFDV